MKIDEFNRCLIATPLLHLPRVAEFIESRSHAFLIDENISYDSMYSLLAERSDISSIFVNPNAQGFILDKKLLSASSSLKCINTCSTGLNHIDLKACNDLGLKLYSLTKDYDLINNLPSTSELAFGMMLALFRNIPQCAEFVLDDNWNYKGVMGHQLSGSRIGVLGYGRLGKIFCNQLSGFGVKVSVCERLSTIQIPTEFNVVDIETLFKTCDAIALHIHSNDDNLRIINKSLLKDCKRGLLLINTSRGDIVDESDIADYILSGKLGGYATDVVATEFGNLDDSPVLKLFKQRLYNIIITPHVGGMTFEGQEKAFLYALNKFIF